MNVTLIATDGPFTYLGQFSTTILDTGIITCLSEHNSQFEILDLTTAPNQKLIVWKRLVGLSAASDRSVLYAPKLGISVPTGKVLAIEEATFLRLEK